MKQLIEIKDLLNNYPIFNHSPLRIVASIFFFILLTYALPRFLTYIADRFDSLTYGVFEHVGDAVSTTLRSTSKYFVYFVSFYFACEVLTLSPKVDTWFNQIGATFLAIQIALWLDASSSFVISRKFSAGGVNDSDNSHKTSSYWLLSFFAKVLIWALAFLLLLDNLGFDVTTLVAGLGVGGIAIALAVQNILGDLFCSLSILLDKPFEVGDFIVVDPIKGTVEKIGLKSTRIRAISGEQIVVSNSDLIQSQVHNFKRMLERRIVFQIGVTYQTSSENLKKIPGMLREAVEQSKNVRFDRAHFFSFGDSALQFEVVYFVLSSDYSIFMDIQQEIYFTVFEKFNELGIDFAYPTQTLFVEKGE